VRILNAEVLDVEREGLALNAEVLDVEREGLALNARM
jgi:hypothetical protein